MTNEHMDCLKYQDRAVVEAAEWRERWPNHCSHCGGFGESSGPRLSYDWEPCGCVLDGVCPRCGDGNLGDDDKVPCSSCRWNWGNSHGDTMPVVEFVCPH